jgi:Ricin-type beta-trefoil lectin domain
MKKRTTILLALSFLLVLWANGKTHSSPIAKAPAGNVPDGMYMIVGSGFGSGRCLVIPNSACGYESLLQTFACDATDADNSQKFNVAAGGSGFYTITPAHSDLCLEVAGDPDSAQAPIQQNVCSPGKVSQQWTMNQYGGNLEIRTARANHCLEVMRADKGIYGQVSIRPCNSGINQRWRLTAKTLNRNGVICRASPSHPEYSCYGSNENQKQVNLGKTLTKARCEEACKASNMVGCKWEGLQ